MDHIQGAKLALRDQLITARGRLGVAEIGRRARALAEVLLELPEVRRAATVTAYVGVGTEPGTGPLLDALEAAGKRVLLPVLMPDFDLDWAVYDGDLVPATYGLLEPSGPRLGPDAITGADVVLVPGLAADTHGNRLGRGAGCYDRALARVAPDTFVCILLNSEEVLATVPSAAHDRPVDAIATEEGIRRGLR